MSETETKKTILPLDIELTSEVRTIYKAPDGKYYLSEDVARQKNATHFYCNCGKGIRSKYRIYCDNCEPEKPKPVFKDWDGKTPLYCKSSDKYFWDLDDIEEYLEENELNKEDLELFICEPSYFREVDEDYWEDVFPEDGELPKVLKEALLTFNEAIKSYGKPASWYPSKIKTTI